MSIGKRGTPEAIIKDDFLTEEERIKEYKKEFVMNFVSEKLIQLLKVQTGEDVEDATVSLVRYPPTEGEIRMSGAEPYVFFEEFQDEILRRLKQIYTNRVGFPLGLFSGVDYKEESKEIVFKAKKS